MDEDLLATCAGLGYTEGDKYFRGEECWECVKDLISFLKLDDESTCFYRLQMGAAQLLQKDLLSILVNFHEDDRLMDVVIRLLLNLTQPAQSCMNKRPLIKKSDLMDMGVYMALNTILRRYKEAFTVESVFQVLGGILGKFCQKEYDKRTDDDIHMVERILGIIRNMLHVPADPTEEKRTSDDVSLHDQVVWSLHTNGFFELFIYIASSSEEQDWILYIAEIMFLMMREQNPSSLASALRGSRAIEEKEQDTRELAFLLERERATKAKKSATYHSRHSRFIGTYECPDIKGTGESSLIYHKPLQDANNLSFDREKRGRKKSRNRRPAESEDLKRTSTLSIRKVLANFCVDFLKSCYNQTMLTVKSRLAAGRCQPNDETYYLWCMRFFMEFSRLHSFNTDIVSATLTMDAFNFVMKQVFATFESVQIEKHMAARPWSKRLQYAIQAYHELLQYVQVLSLSSDEQVRDNAKIMQRNIFYIPEYRDVFVSLLKGYDEVKADKTFLSDVVETVHLYMKLIERYCKERGGRIIVQARKKATKGGGKKSGGGGGGRGGGASHKKGPWSLSDEQMQELWEEHAEFASLMLQTLSSSGDENNDAVPFDAASELPDDVQRSSTAELIRSHLLSSAYRRACQLFRAARDIWRDGTFGDANSTIEEEIVCMRQIFFDLILPDLPPDDEDEPPAAGTQGGSQGDGVGDGSEFVSEGAGLNDDDDEEDRQRTVSYDLEFNLQLYVAKFANAKVVHNYGLLLERYATNSPQLNHAAVKMMYRIAHDCQLLPLFYQLSLFAVYDKILNDPASSKHMVELYKFSAYVVRNFVERAQVNPVLYAEALLWKDGAACHELQHGYGTAQSSKDRILMQRAWSEEQQQQLAQLYDRFQGSDDLVGDIVVEITGPPERSRRHVSHQLIKQGLVTDRKELRRKGASAGNPDRPKAKRSQWADNDIVPSDADVSSSSDDDGDVESVLARFRQQANDSVEDLDGVNEDGASRNGLASDKSDDSGGDDSNLENAAAKPKKARAEKPSKGAPMAKSRKSRKPADDDMISGDDSSSDDDVAAVLSRFRKQANGSDAASSSGDENIRKSGSEEESDIGAANRKRRQPAVKTVGESTAATATSSSAGASSNSQKEDITDDVESQTPRFAAAPAARRRARVSDDSSEEEKERAQHRPISKPRRVVNNDTSDDSDDEGALVISHRNQLSDSDDDDEPVRKIGSPSSYNESMIVDESVHASATAADAESRDVGESHTPSFAAPRRARIVDSDDDEEEESATGASQSHDASLPAGVGAKRARILDSSDEEENSTEATPSFAKRIYEE